MKDPLLAIQTKLKTDVTIIALVSTRVYRDKLPDSPVFPCISLHEISDINDDYSTTGDYAHARIQAAVWSQGAGSGEASAISRAVRSSLHGLANTTLASGDNPVYVTSCVDGGAQQDQNTDVSPIIWVMHRDFILEYLY